MSALPAAWRPRWPGRRTPHPRLQEVEEDQLQRPVGRDRLELDPQVDAGPLDLGGVGGEPPQVLGPGLVGVDVELTARFDVEEHGGRGERERHLGRVEDPQHDHVVPARPQVAQPGLQGRRLGEQVRDQDDQPALADGGGDLLERTGQVGRPARRARARAPP